MKYMVLPNTGKQHIAFYRNEQEKLYERESIWARRDGIGLLQILEYVKLSITHKNKVAGSNRTCN